MAYPYDSLTQAPSIAKVPLGRRAAIALKSGIDTALDVNAGVNRIVSAPGRAIVGAVGDAANAVGQFGKDFFNLPEAQAAAPASIARAPAVAPAVAAPAVAPVPAHDPNLDTTMTGTLTTPPAAVAAAPAVAPQAAIARLQQPPGIVAPVKAPLGPLPTLDEGQNQNIFSAMGKLSRDSAAYRDRAALNAQQQGDFTNASKAYQDNLKAMSETAAANVGIGAENRANIAQPPSIAHTKAQTDLYKEQADKAKQETADRKDQQALATEYSDPKTTPERKRVIAELMLAKHGKEVRPQPIYEQTEGSMGQIIKRPMVLNHATGKYEYVTPEGGGQTNTQAPQAALDHLKKNPAMKDAFKQKYGYLPAGA